MASITTGVSMTWKNIGRPLAMMGMMLVFNAAGCGSHDSGSEPGSQDPGSEPGPFGDHNFRLLLTDFPLDDEEVTKVLVTFNRIEIHGEETGWFTAADYGPAGRTFDLLTLQDGRTDELGAFDLAPGAYTEIRLILAEENLIEVDDGSGPALRPLKVPSGEQTGIKLQGDFIVVENGFTQVVLDFNAEKSVHRAGDKYMLHPVIHIVSIESFPGIEILSPPDNYQTQVPHVAVTGRVTNLITGPIQNVTATFAGESFLVPVQADGRFAFDLNVPIGDSVTVLPLEVAGSNEAGHSARVVQNIIAVPAFAPEQVVVRFLPTSSLEDVTNVVNAFGGTVVGSIPKIKLYKIALPPGTDIRQRLPTMNARDEVAYALPNFYATAAVLARDDEYPEQHALRHIGIETAWDTTRGRADIVVAILDDGIKRNHPDFAGNLYENNADNCTAGVDDDANGFIDDCHGWDFVDDDNDPSHASADGHGTAVASIIGAKPTDFPFDGSGMAGVNWDVKLLPIRVYGGGTVPDLFNIVDGVEYAVQQGADIINISLRGILAIDDPQRQKLDQLFKDVNDLGSLIVMAAGNDRLDLDNTATDCMAVGMESCILFPVQVNIPNKLVVGASTLMDQRADFSNFGEATVHLFAPGVDVLAADSKNDTRFPAQTGTSIAAAFVSGVAALTLAANPKFRNQGILLKEQLRGHGIANGVSIDDVGRLDASAAVDPRNEPLPLLINPPRGLFQDPSDYRVNDTHLIPCDVDGDHDEDMVVVVGAAGTELDAQTLLFINGTTDAPGPFINGTDRLGLAPGYYLGGDCGDVDNDGDKDLVLAGFDPFPPGRRNKILINDGNGLFDDLSDQLLPDIVDLSRDIDLFDADNDGDLDMFVSNAALSNVPDRLLLNQLCEPGQPCERCELGQPCPEFLDAPEALPIDESGDGHNATIGDIDNDGDLDIYVANELQFFLGSGVDQLLINQLVESGNRQLSFVDEATTRGLPATDGHAHQGAFLDANRDGCLDLVVVRRHEEANSLYLNDKDGLVCTGEFVLINDDTCFPIDQTTTSTLDVGDLDLDGFPDIYLGNGDPNVFVAEQDYLLLNRGGTNGCYDDSGDSDDAFGVPQGVINTTKHVSFIDVDLDGDCDIWTGNHGERDGLLLNTTCNGTSPPPTSCRENLSRLTTPGVPDALRNYCGLEVQFASPPGGG